MSAINPSVDLTLDDDVALIAMKNPPVNALKHELREGVAKALDQVRDEGSIRFVVLAGGERAFSAGADITEFGKPPRDPMLPALIAKIEAFPKPVIAAIAGVAMGGGLELALGCHYRLAWAGARMALPEIKLGLLPGAGGTQRLPRAVGPTVALETILSGEPIPVPVALKEGLVDAVLDGAFPAAAIAWARTAPAGALPRLRDRNQRLAEIVADPKSLDSLAKPQMKKAASAAAAKACIDAVRAAAQMDFDDGLAFERKLFVERLSSPDSLALRHVFFAEREAQKVPGLGRDIVPRKIQRAAVIGAGTMGGGIAMCFANAGIPVTVIEASREVLDQGMGRIVSTYETSVERGSLDAQEASRRLQRIAKGLDFELVGEADIVIEAVFEEMDLKKQIFRDLDRHAKKGAILASNTSYLDVNAIASATGRPGDVLGTHFFSPANVMRLLEIVRGAKTEPAVLATAIDLARTLGKVPVVVGVCDGFVGNRMLARRSAQAERLLLEGALPQEIDKALTDFGFRMGPFAMGDLAGLDVGWRARKARGLKAPVADALCEAGRYGQKTGRGFYNYTGGRTPLPDPEVEALIVATSERLGIARRNIAQEEIFDRLTFPMINEGARILEEGIATRPGDIDVVWLYGYNWPATTGGPMYHADTVGLPTVAARLEAFAKSTGDASLEPAPLLKTLAASGDGFATLARRPAA